MTLFKWIKSLFYRTKNKVIPPKIPTRDSYTDDIISSTVETKKRLAIVVGHTKSAQGANTYSLPTLGRRMSEYELNTMVANRTKWFLHQMSSNCAVKIFFRDGIGIKEAYKQAKKWGATHIVELHHNSMGHESSYEGAEVLVYKGDKDSAELADKFLAEFCPTFRVKNRGVKVKSKSDRGGTSLYYGSKYAKYALLLEPCFIGYRNHETVRLLEGSGLEDYSRFIAEFITEN